MALLTQLRYGVEYLALRTVIGIVRLVPLDKAVPLSAWTWRKLAPLGKRRHKRALDNLAIAFPEKTPEQREQIALDAWSNLGRVMVETMQLDRILQQPERIEVINKDTIERYRGKLGSLICCSLHTGNWELASWPLVEIEAHSAAIYRLVNNPYVDAYLRKQRERLYPDGMFSRGATGINRAAGLNTARHIGSYLRQGGRIGMLVDLYDRRGIEVPFFGREASSSVFPALLARRIGCRIWLGRCIRINEESRFKVEMVEIKVPFSDNKDEDIKAITTSIQGQFEEWIREYPEQWMWSNRKWS
ncbi:MAG: lysophospholipid acyltransferase family protein [Hyphomicrobiaceae bacterium]|nr:lysophospholipid acyltransferase family protein [Hyphomicrobiaceae bacterium]